VQLLAFQLSCKVLDMQAPASNAIQNNQRLFGPFSRKLASDDPAVYSAFAEKFAVWLSDERAYYLEARPEVSGCCYSNRSLLKYALNKILRILKVCHILLVLDLQP
jgi:hypothetical protein